MSVSAPHYLLFSEAAPANDPVDDAGRWRFVLRAAAGPKVLEAADEEPAAAPDRLELLAIIRGLEALDRPSRVTLVTARRSIQHGLRSGLSYWRENDWQWERYGKLAPVKNADLWRRIERLAGIHTVECRCSRPKAADDLAPPPAVLLPTTGGRKWRVDQQHSAGSTQSQARNPSQAPSPQVGMTTSAHGSLHLGFSHLNLLHAASFVVRASKSVFHAFQSLTQFRQHTT
jgi:ribonuclease HI